MKDVDNHYVFCFLGIKLKIKHKSYITAPVVTEMGILSSSKFRNPKVIVSLTSFPARIYAVVKTLSTLLTQTLKPDLVILWLAREQFKNQSLPKELTDLQEFGLSIKWCDNLRSYKKLIPTLREFPNDIIITADDDIYYQPTALERLYNSYLENPKAVICHRVSRIKLKNNCINLIKNFDYCSVVGIPSYLNFLIGGALVLYPPNVLHSNILDERFFLDFLPTHDDVFFWAMAVLKDTKISIARGNLFSLNYVEGTQQYGLVKINKNRGSGLPISQAFNRVIRYYPAIVEKLKNEI